MLPCPHILPNSQLLQRCRENLNLSMGLIGSIFKFSIVEEVGCFQDNANDRAFPTMLKNMRGGIDWHHLEKIVQKCAILTKENNYKVRCLTNRKGH